TPQHAHQGDCAGTCSTPSSTPATGHSTHDRRRSKTHTSTSTATGNPSNPKKPARVHLHKRCQLCKLLARRRGAGLGANPLPLTAKNILALGRRERLNACGADVRHSGSSRVRSAVKQEAQPVRAG